MNEPMKEAIITNKKEKKSHKKQICILSISIGILLLVLLLGMFFYKPYKYSKATNLYSEKRYEEAISIFKDLGDYRDSKIFVKKAAENVRKIEEEAKIFNIAYERIINDIDDFFFPETLKILSCYYNEAKDTVYVNLEVEATSGRRIKECRTYHKDPANWWISSYNPAYKNSNVDVDKLNKKIAEYVSIHY